MSKGSLVSGIKPSKNFCLKSTAEEHDNIFPPAAALVNGEYCLLSGSEAEEYYVVQAESTAGALNMAVILHGALSITELAKLAVICKEHSIDTAQIDAFSQYNIKGRQGFQTLEAVDAYPEALKKYLTAKDIPLKTLAVFNKLNEDCKKYVVDAVAARELTVGDFRNLVNLLFDMMPKIKPEDLQGNIIKNLSAKKDRAGTAFSDKLKELTERFPLTVSSPDNFETGRLVFSFTAESAEEFMEIITKTSEESNTSKLKKIYGFLDEQNIS
ncbi:hypothetical protein [Seleniivibrio woodruffii]|uniref:hypothetical protein n=1 Tax=Seleniivibrio woodruffii TaxID=1078050 RepID=UPI0039E41960